MEISFSHRFEAAHRLTSAASPKCQTPHGHTWYVTLNLRPTTTSLDPKNDMVVEFGEAKNLWKNFLQETVDHSFFYNQKTLWLKK